MNLPIPIEVCFPKSAHFSENKQSYFPIKGQCYVCGKKMLSSESVSFPKESRRRENTMKNSNQINVPQAREAMDKFKMQAASEVGVNLKQGYNGDITAREAGSVGGQMVKNKCPIRTMKYDRHNRITMGHIQTVQYIVAITV